MKRPVIQQDPEKVVESPVLAQAIVDLSKAAQKLSAGGLNRKAVIVLLAHSSKVAMRDCDIVLSHLEHLARTYCK